MSLPLALIIAGALVAAFGDLFAPDGDVIGVTLIGATLATAGVWLIEFKQRHRG